MSSRSTHEFSITVGVPVGDFEHIACRLDVGVECDQVGCATVAAEELLRSLDRDGCKVREDCR